MAHSFAASMEPVAGADLTSSLRLLRPLGHGGMGVLWLAQHRALGSEVVIKFLGDRFANDPARAKRTAREAAATARVRSPHVVQILDHGVSDGRPFIVMERLVGRDLRSHLAERGCLSARETTMILHQVAKALDKTHAARLVHRDVKPSNIFLCDDGGETFVKLLDFGLATRSDPADRSTTDPPRCAGTPPYMSPEQLVGDPIDGRSDLWSLGVVAFECLTGRRPFEGETLGAITLAIHAHRPPRPTAAKSELPAEIDAWFARACAPQPRDRFAGALEATEAMASALSVPLAAARSSPSLGEAPRPADRTITSDFSLARETTTVRRGGLRRWGPRALAWPSAVALVALAAHGRWMGHPAKAAGSPSKGVTSSQAAPAELPSARSRGSPHPSVAREDREAPPGEAASAIAPVPSTPRSAPRPNQAIVPRPGGRAIDAPARPPPAAADAGSLDAPAFELPDERH